MTMAINEEVDIRMTLQIFFCIKYQMFLILPHVIRFFAVHPLFAAMFCPRQAQFHTPTGMDGRKQCLKCCTVKHPAQQLKLLVRVTQSVTVSQIKLFSVYFGSQCFTVNNHSTFFRKIIPTPDIMVAGKEMYLHSHIREFGELS